MFYTYPSNARLGHKLLVITGMLNEWPKPFNPEQIIYFQMYVICPIIEMLAYICFCNNNNNSISSYTYYVFRFCINIIMFK